MLRDLTIQNYRCFKNFQVDGLAPVNLIVGMNNSGKTSLLEAIYLLVSQNDPQRLVEVLYNRGEIAERYIGSRVPGEAVRRSTGYQVTHIFYGHRLRPGDAIHLKSKREQRLSLDMQLHAGARQAALTLFEETSETDISTSSLSLLFAYGNHPILEVPVRDDGAIDLRYFRFQRPDLPHRFLTTNNLDFSQLAELWDGITLTPKEENVIAALQILEPTLERISFTSRQTSNSGILLKLRKQNEPIPLGSMGDGMRRLLTLAASAVMAEEGVLLVDEIDTGLYYQTQNDMWRLLIETAQRLNVQVFATTHSSDCVRAFQEALDQSKDRSVGSLFRLSKRGEKIEAVSYTADELAVAIRQDIEVR